MSNVIITITRCLFTACIGFSVSVKLFIEADKVDASVVRTLYRSTYALLFNSLCFFFLSFFLPRFVRFDCRCLTFAQVFRFIDVYINKRIRS